MTSQVRKRDGRLEAFNPSKIASAILKAFNAVGEGGPEEAERLAKRVAELVEARFEGSIPSVEDVQDVVEEALIKAGYARAAKAYILYRQKRAEVRGIKEVYGVKDDLKLSLNAVRVLERRYLLKDLSGRVVETTSQLFWRVARALAAVDELYGASRDEVARSEVEFYRMMAGLEFLPNSPTLMNAGTSIGQLSACFVLPVEDSIEGIFNSLKLMATIHKSGGGCVSHDAFIYTTMCGLTPIGEFVERFIPDELKPLEDTVSVDVSKLDLKALAYDPAARATSFSRVLRVWRYVVPAERAIKLKLDGGLEVTVSDWHPFLVVEGGDVALRRADEVEPGSYILLPSTPAPWPFEERPVADGVEATPALAWALGYILGRGSVGRRHVSVFDRDEGRLRRLKEVLEACFKAEVDLVEGGGRRPGWILQTLDERVVGFMRKLLRPEGSWRVPPIIFKAPLDVILSFLSGVLEAGARRDGRLRLPAAKRQALEHLSLLLSAVGVRFKASAHEGSLMVDPSELKAALGGEGSTALRAARVESAERLKGGKLKMYDLTVEGSETYAAGRWGFTIVHNTGFSFSRLRPRGDVVASTAGVASGPVSFMRIFDVATEVIKQGGKRRGANMGVLRVDHPDILEFINAKATPGAFANFNLSVAATDEFMEAVKENRDYALINPRTKEAVKRLPARDVFDLIVANAWRTGDPGLLFIDEVNRHNPTPKLGEIEATNPCGEVPLLPYESCNLGSVNLSRMVKRGEVDWERLGDVVEKAMHLLDNVIDANRYPAPEIERATKLSRKVGLGVMGFAEMLIQLDVPYDSKEALRVGEEVASFISKRAREASVELGRRRGSFPSFEESVWAGKFDALRNATVTSIAPTGTISIIANTSSGIEPLFALAYVRQVLEDTRLLEVNPLFERVARERGFYSQQLMLKVAKQGSVKGLSEVPEDVRRLFVTALEVDPEWHVRMQAAFQRHVDNAVAKTVNLRPEASMDDVRRAFMLAYELKCKGITVYRYGSKPTQVLYLGLGVEAEGGAPSSCPSTVCAT